jgi:hypothetical protein
MIEAALTPFLKDLARYQKLGLRDQANRMCEGLLLGFHRFEHESTSRFKDWAPDAPISFAGSVDLDFFASDWNRTPSTARPSRHISILT